MSFLLRHAGLRKNVGLMNNMFRTSVRFMGDHGPISQHRNTSDNTDDHSFDFTVENYKKVDAILSRYPSNFRKSGIIPLLDLGQRQNDNFCSLAVMKKVAQICEVSDMEVYEVATFYTMFNKERVGKFFIQLCGTTPCMVCGSEEIKKTILDHLGVGEAEVTPDGMFSLLEVECLGACANAPMVQINDDFFECLTPDSTIELLEYIRENGETPPLTKWGSRPMNGQYSCEGPQGKTTLKSKPTGPGFGMRELEPKVNPADVMEEMYGGPRHQ